VRRHPLRLDGDRDVDNNDILAIRAKNGQTVPPADPKFDANGDGKINVADMRFCQLRKTPLTRGSRHRHL